MNSTGTGGFGALLRQYRLAVGLTQEALAERAGLGVRSIQHLERGETHPQRGTAHRLAVALALGADQRAAFEALAQPVPRRRIMGEGAMRSPLAGGTIAGTVASAGDAPTLDRDAGAGLATATLSTTPRVAHNLPVQLTRFVGRERELAEVTHLLGGARLLTLTGAGGCGKTRLALQVAAGLLDAYSDGVWLVELAPLADPTLVPLAVVRALGLREETGQPVSATLHAALRPRHLLLVVDNCEHLLDACAGLVAALTRACPAVTVLATSREPLGLAGETAWRVPSLAAPDPHSLPPLEEVMRYEAVRLFSDRAVAVASRFAVTERNALAVAHICHRLDGIPLAIELAAARVRSLAVDQLATRLDQRFRLLTGGDRTALARQQTLRATVDWSYDLLSASEQTLFARLAVFAGSFTIEAAEAVCADGTLAAEEVLGLLLRLVDKSLVVADAEDHSGGIERYRLLETLRQYGRERWPSAEAGAALHARHAAYYGTLAEEVAAARGGPHGSLWFDRLEAEHGNLRQALRWAIDTQATQDGLQLATFLTRFWYERGYWGEGQQWARELLALPGAAERTVARAWALNCLVVMHRGARLRAGSQRVGDDVLALATEAVSIARERADRPLLAQTLFQLGTMRGRQDYAAGVSLLEESHALYAELYGQEWTTGVTNTRGDLAWEQGDREGARSWWTQGLRMGRQRGLLGTIATELGDLGMMAFHEGDYVAAGRQIAESLALHRTLHSRMGLSISLGSLGVVARAQGDTELARSCGEEKLALWQEVGDRAGIAATLDELGAVAQQEGDDAGAASLFREALTLRRELGNPVDIAASLVHLGGLACAQGDVGSAASLYMQALELLGPAGDSAVAAECLEGLAGVAWARGRLEQATRLQGAASTLRRGIFVLFVWDDRTARERQVAALCRALGEAAFASAWSAGQGLTLEQAIAEGLAEVEC